MYGPAFELCERCAANDGSVDYQDSEQYEVKWWAWDAPGNLGDLIKHVNQIRKLNAALQSNDRLTFQAVGNDQIIAYTKMSMDGRNIVLTVVNLDPHHVQRGWLDLSLEGLGLTLDGAFTAHDLLADACYNWRGTRSYIELDPGRLPAHIFRLEQPTSLVAER